MCYTIERRGDVRLIAPTALNRLRNCRAYYSTGFGGVSRMPGGCSMNLAMFKKCRNDTFENVRENFRRFAEACGFPLELMSLHREVHEPGVAVVRREDLPEDIFDRSAYGEADVQVTADPSVALFVYAADCCTVMVADPEREVRGTAHCGWRNSVNGTIPALMEAFERLGGRPGHSLAVVGPAISMAHYDLDDEAAERFTSLGFGDCLGGRRENGRLPVDLPRVNARQLTDCGVPAASLSVLPLCTWESRELRLPSYRRDGGLNAMLGGVLFNPAAAASPAGPDPRPGCR